MHDEVPSEGDELTIREATRGLMNRDMSSPRWWGIEAPGDDLSGEGTAPGTAENLGLNSGHSQGW